MRGLFVAAGLLTSTLASTLWAAAPEPARQEPIYTRQNVFKIPFRLERPPAGESQPAEVMLYVTENQAEQWSLHSRVKPQQAGFDFEAPHDGQYRFALRTLDRQGKTRPEGPLAPQLMVVVDTLVPRLDISAARGPNGEVQARWHALDENLKPDSFKIEYQSASDAPWENLAIGADSQHIVRLTLVGEDTWWPATAPGSGALLRASISDQAGNPAVSQVQLKEGASDEQAAAAGSADAPGRSSERLANTADSGPGRERLDSVSGQRREPVDSDTRRWPADRATDRTLGQSLPEAGAGGLARSAQGSDWRTARSGDPRGGPSQARVAAQPVSQDFQAAAAGQAATAGQGATAGGGRGGFDVALMPPGERARMVNQPTFELDYEIDDVGPSGIAKVDLWGTRDGGRSWASYGSDNDNRSPMVVAVDGEGVYGFRVVVHSGSGLSGAPPRDGELPEIWIGVDLTRPQARLLGVEPGSDRAELSVRWQASDTLLETRPISLFFSDQPHGPWTPIASGLENTGSYAWRPDSRVPEKIYLRIEARDEAGNVGAFETADAMPLDRQRPQGRIRGIRPLGHAQ